MKTTIKILLVSGILISTVAFSVKKTEERESEKAVKELVLSAYVNGAFNDLDTDAMQKGFHEDFSIYSAKGEELSKYPIADWVASSRKRRDNGYDATDEKNVWKPTFVSVDVTGGAAQVKVELRNQGNHVYTDYLSLLKFESGWRIVAKVYHSHK
ncbi:MAG: nuclear transport factor 2 family protein [Cyclobacteriaceae bacterium]